MYNEQTRVLGDDSSIDTIVVGLTIQEFVEEMEARDAPQRHIRRVRPRKPHRTSSSDRGSGPRQRIELVLYTSPSSEKSQKALRAVRDVLDQYDTSQVKFTVRDMSITDGSADEDGVIFTPTLVKRGPGPRTWIVGNLDHAELLMDLLDVSGVERRRG